MYKSNDCIKLTKQHLRNYKYYVTALENITEDIKCVELELQNQGIKATRYGSIPGGGSELSTTEQAAELRIKLTQEKEDLIQKRKELQRQVNKIAEDHRHSALQHQHFLVQPLFQHRLDKYHQQIHDGCPAAYRH